MARLALRARGVIGFVVFGVYGGLVPATFLSVFIAAMGDRTNGIRGAVLLARGSRSPACSSSSTGWA